MKGYQYQFYPSFFFFFKYSIFKVAKSTLIINEILQEKAILGKYLKEKCYLDHYQQLSFKYFVKLFLFFKFQVICDKDTDKNVESNSYALMG